MRRAHRAHAVARPGVPDLARGCGCHRATQVAEERLALRPVPAHDDHLARDAVVSGVLQAHGRDVLGLEGEVGLGPRAGHDDHRGHAAQLRGDRIRQQRLAGRFATGGIVSRSPDDRVERPFRAGDVHVVDALMACEVGAHLATAPHDAQQTGLHQRGECALEDRHERILRGVHLQQRHPVVSDQLGEHVGDGDRRHVAGAEHEAHAARDRRRALTEPGGGSGTRDGDVAVEPHLAGESRRDDPIRRVAGEHPRPHPAVGGEIHRHPVEGISAAREVPHRAGQPLGRDEGHIRTREPLLAAQGMAGRQTLRDGRRVGPFLTHRGGARVDALQQRRPLIEREPRPQPRAAVQRVDIGVERLASLGGEVDGRGGHGVPRGVSRAGSDERACRARPAVRSASRRTTSTAETGRCAVRRGRGSRGSRLAARALRSPVS